MKKKAKLSIVAVALLMAIALPFTQKEEAYTNTQLLENVEAIASGEDYNHVYCLGSGCIDCPGTYHKVKWVDMFRSSLK